MFSNLRLGAVAAICLLAIATTAPASAQERRRSGSSVSSGAKAAPRAARAEGQATAARPRPAQTPASGAKAVPRPAQPRTVIRTSPRTVYGVRGYRPWYGHGGSYWGSSYWGFSPSFYYGFGGYYGPYFNSGWGYSPFWGPSAFWGPSPYYYAYTYGPGGANLKVEVKPKTAEVYVDGFLAGTVDEFDGMFQSLPVEPGGHEIVVYHQGYKPIRQQLYMNPGSTQRIKGEMEPLPQGEMDEPRPQPAPAPPGQQAQPAQGLPDEPYWILDPQSPVPARKARDAGPPPPADASFGQVAIRVQPADATVTIDGEAWSSPAGAERLLVHLTPGTHRIEIRKEGFDPFVTAVEIKRGETTVLNVSLAKD